MPNLTIRDEGKESVLQIEGETATIGRAPTNTITIEDPSASKEHCIIERVGDRWRLVDLESKNGTRVNGSFRNKSYLEHGDTIRIGHSEIRFGLEASRRKGGPVSAAAAAPSAPRGAAPRGAARTRDRVDEPGTADRPPSSRYRKSGSDQFLLWGLVAVGVVVVFLVVGKVASRLQPDTWNRKVLERAKELETQGRWRDALEYLRENGRPGGNAYFKVEEEIERLTVGIPTMEEKKAETQARSIVARLGLKIRAYNRGADIDPKEIFAMVERLKTEYADTPQTEGAREAYPAWFAGKVPKRARDVLGEDDYLEQEWREALARAQGYERENRFREAIETIDRFVSTREAILEESQVRDFRARRDRQRERILRAAAGKYHLLEQQVDRHVKNSRFDRALAIMRDVAEKFGLDRYVRKARAKIREIEQAESGG